MKISQLKKLLEEYPDDPIVDKIKAKLAKLEKGKVKVVEKDKDFNVLTEQIKVLIEAVKNKEYTIPEFPKEIKISNPAEVKEVTVNVPDDVRVRNLDQIKYPKEIDVKNLDQIKFPKEIKVSNFPKAQKITIPDKVEIKNTDKIIEPLLKALQTTDTPVETSISRDSKGISRIDYVFATYKLTVFITRDRIGKIINLRYVKETYE